MFTPAFAVHDNGLFELDGNTAAGAAPGDDWSNVFLGTDGAFASSFINDTFANGVILGFEARTPETSFFTGGGSKDVNCIQDPCVLGGKKGGGWLYDTVNDVVPDKNDIVTAFAAAYEELNGDQHTIFYFGLDTYAVQGDANAGFWFFRQPVTLNPLEPGETVGTFNGGHSDGDIFVAVAYTGGGKIGEIKVYEWDATISGNKPIGLVEIATGLDCADAAPDDDVCGVVNSAAGEDPAWNYLNKDGGTSYDVPAFVEFGLDIEAALGHEIGCFSSFMAETRSSQSETAQLKDFALGAFPVCGIEVTKQADDLSKVGDDIDYSITIENTGIATLYKHSITDSLVGDLTSDAGCGASLAAGTTCTINYTYTVQTGDPDPLENTVTIVYTEFSGGQGIQLTDEYTATVNLFQPAISFDKKAEGSDGPLTIDQGNVVDYTLFLSNDSSTDSPNLICSITDTNLGVNVTGLSLGAGSDHTVNQSLTFNMQTPDPLPAVGQPLPSPWDWCVMSSVETFLCENIANALCSPVDFPNQLPAQDRVTVEVIPADVLLTVLKEGDAFGKVGDPVDYTITITNDNDIESVTLISIDDTLLGDLKNPANYTSSTCAPSYQLAPLASCVITASRTVLSTDPDPLPNEVTVTGEDQFANSAQAIDDHTVDLIHPDYAVTKDCLPAEPVPPGSFVSFRIDIDNTGDAELVLTSVYDTLLGELLSGAPDPVDLNERGSAACTETDYGTGPTTGCLRIEESYQVGSDDVFNLVTVDAELNARYGLPNTFQRSDDALCEVEVLDITRTQGFWKTHGSDGTKFAPPVDKGYTCYVANQLLPINLGWMTLDTCEDVFGIFWESPADCDKLEKVKLHASHQYLAALLNYQAFGSPIPESCKSNGYEAMTTEQLFQAMRDALGTGNRHVIKKLASIFACYNESGDEQAIVDTVPVPHADPNGTRGIADLGICD